MEPNEKKEIARERRQTQLVCALLVVSVLLIFWPAIRFEFINYDDPDYVASNANVQKGFTWESIKWAFTTGHASNWHPVTWLSHMLDWQIFGNEPGAHHLMNVFLHAANSVLLFLALRKLTSVRRNQPTSTATPSLPSDGGEGRGEEASLKIPSPQSSPHSFVAGRGRKDAQEQPSSIDKTSLVSATVSESPAALWACAFVAALFALHPLHVESVAWVSERKDVLSAFFWMLTMWCYATYATLDPEAPNFKRRKMTLYFLTLIVFALGLMSKPMLVTLPFVLLLLDFWPLERVTRDKSQVTGEAQTTLKSRITHCRSRFTPLVLEKVPFFALVAISSALTFWAQNKGGAVTSLNALPLAGRVTNALISYPRYLWKMIWPQDLAVLYPHSWTWHWGPTIAAAAFLLAATGLVIWKIVKRPFLAVGWFWFLGTLVPVIGLVQVGLQAIADRYTYIPLIGIFIVIAWGARELFFRFPKMKSALWVSACAVLLICAVLTSQQLRLWQNSGTLFSHAVKVTKKNFLAHNNLGFYLYNQGKVDEAISHYRQALEAYSQFDIAWNNMGYALANQDKHHEAIIHYRQALKLNPKHADVHNNLGNALGNVGKAAEAIAEYRAALELKPEHADAHNNLGVALAQEGKFEEGVRHLLESVRLDPKKASARSNLGNAFAIQGKFDEAIEQYEVALRLNNSDAQAHNNLANVLSSKNRLNEAVAHYKTAITLNTNNPEAHCNLGFVLVKQNKLEEARAHLQEALRLRPNYPEVQRQLNALNQSGKP